LIYEGTYKNDSSQTLHQKAVHRLNLKFWFDVFGVDLKMKKKVEKGFFWVPKKKEVKAKERRKKWKSFFEKISPIEQSANLRKGNLDFFFFSDFSFAQ
jgi:hypothetical protein